MTSEQKEKIAPLMDELLTFPESAWVYKCFYGEELRKCHKAVRQPLDKTIVFRTKGGWVASKCLGETVNYIGMPEEVTYSQWKKARAALAKNKEI